MNTSATHAPAAARPELDPLDCPLDGTTLIEASAGTGKTWAICALYLRLVLEADRKVDGILVVTFTNAASAELRDRLRTRLTEALRFARDGLCASGETYIPALMGKLEAGGTARATLVQRLELAIESFDTAAVFTIHGFCQRALAEAPFSAALPFATEVISDDADLRRQVVNDFWRRTVNGGDEPAAALAYLIERGDSPETFDAVLRQALRQPLAQVVGLASDSPTVIDDRALHEAWQIAHARWASDGERIVADLITSRLNFNQVSYKEASIRKGAAAIDRLMALNDPQAAVLMVERSLSKGKWHEDDAPATLFAFERLHGAAKNKTHDSLSDAFFSQWQAVLTAAVPLAPALGAWRRNLLARLLAEGPQALRERKRALRVTSFDDMLNELHRALCRNTDEAAAHALAGRLRERYPVALIDEFQDTDPVQFEVFRTLYPDASGSSLLLVGDPKQAIYSFRQADLHTYLRAAGEARRGWSLAANQRSSAALIGAINRLFDPPDPRPRDGLLLMPGLAYQPVHRGQRPRPEFHDPEGDPAALQVRLLPDGGAGLNKARAVQLSMQAMAAEAARLLRGGLAGTVRIDERGLEARDIAVLVRSHRHGKLARDALAALGIGSVVTSRANVYQSPDASELARVLRAVLEPSRMNLLCAAKATELLGATASQLAALRSDESQTQHEIERLRGYGEQWRRRGFAFMFRTLLADEGIFARMLARGDGERRLTNLLHLGDLLQQAARQHLSPESLLAWFEHAGEDDSRDEASELRLESDRNLVQIVTYHKSKGLEYPVVFCPTLWDIGTRAGGRKPEGLIDHDPDSGEQRLDFSEENRGAISERNRNEERAEDLRLAYVALTRAVHRCWVGVATTLASNDSPVRTGPLNWLVAGAGLTPAEWLAARDTEGKKDTGRAAARLAAWQALDHTGSAPGHDQPGTQATGQSISVREMSADGALPVPIAHVDIDALRARDLPARIAPAWRMSSYSGLSRGALAPAGTASDAPGVPTRDPSDDTIEADHDGLAAMAESDIDASAGKPGEDADSTDFLDFPRGASAGNCVHAVMEEADFTDASTWSAAIDAALQAHPQTFSRTTGKRSYERDLKTDQKRLALMLRQMLGNVVDVTLPDGQPGSTGIRLAEIGRASRLTEWAFTLPARELDARTLNRELTRLGYEGPRLSFDQFSGYLSGYVDLIYRHGGRYWIIDWKSNHLGREPARYAPTPIAQAMAGNGYHLQYLLYTVALHRMLQRRQPDYDYDRHVGGVHYLFMRGVRPDWVSPQNSSPGVHFDRPARTTIEALDRLLGGEGPTRPDGTQA